MLQVRVLKSQSILSLVVKEYANHEGLNCIRIDG